MKTQNKKTFEVTLPPNYYPALVIDAKNTRFALIMNLVALAVIVLCVGVTLVFLPSFDLWEEFNQHTLLRYLIFLAVMIGYVILHELTHGVAYKILTHRKLTFGLTLTVAYCGIPDVYVTRRTALISLLAPFLTFLPVFLIPIFLLPLNIDKLLCSFCLGMHIGGCSGDLYDTFLLLFRFRSPETLMQDTGPKQTFYLPEKNA